MVVERRGDADVGEVLAGPRSASHHAAPSGRLVALADSLVDGVDAIDLADRVVQDCRELLGVAEAAIVLDDLRGHVSVLASTTEGGCLDTILEEPDVDEAEVEERLRACGLTTSYGIPLRFRDSPIGAIRLFCQDQVLSEAQLDDVRLLASLATMALLSHRAIDRRESVAQRLQAVLNDRITVEQAKGVLAERDSLTPAAALHVMRAEAEHAGVALSTVAQRVVVEQERRAWLG